MSGHDNRRSGSGRAHPPSPDGPGRCQPPQIGRGRSTYYSDQETEELSRKQTQSLEYRLRRLDLKVPPPISGYNRAAAAALDPRQQVGGYMGDRNYNTERRRIEPVATATRPDNPGLLHQDGDLVPTWSREMEEHEMSAGASASAPKPQASPTERAPKPIDCEIVVLNKALQNYGERIEKCLRDCGLDTDIIFPIQGLNMNDFLTSFANVGTRFAVIIEENSEKDQRMNFYQFQGFPRVHYHKNIPVHTGLQLIVQRYQSLLEQEVGSVPDTIKTMISKVLADKLIKDEEYPILIGFINERQIKQQAFKREPKNNNSDDPEMDVDNIMQSEEGMKLQQQIMAIINEDNGK